MTTATVVHEPAHPNREATYRALDLTDAGDRESAIALRLANAPHREPTGHREFLGRSMDSMTALQEAGAGAWFGAFLAERMVSGMGLFSDGSGLARFQSVDTHPDSCGRGLAGWRPGLDPVKVVSRPAQPERRTTYDESSGRVLRLSFRLAKE